MTHVRSWVGTIVAAVVATIGLTAPAAAAEGQILSVQNAVKDSYLVELRDSGLRSQSVTSAVGTLAGRYGATVTHTYQHAVHGFAATVSEADARRLAADPAVLRVQQNGIVSASGTQPAPPSYGLDRIDQRNRPLSGSYTYPNTANNVRAYVIDTGIRVSHQEFGGRAVFGVNTIDSVNTDCNGHGTHVAGTVGGASTGVAKGVALIAVKVLGCDGRGTDASTVAGIDWVTANHASGPAVANMSLGGAGSPMVDNAVRNSIADGIVYAVASGNDNRTACGDSPARVAEAITVNSTDSNDVRAASSNFGACTDIFAPGAGITSAWPASDTTYATLSGTSMATPHVTGAAALVLGLYPFYAPQQVADILYADATVNVVGNPGAGSPNRLLFVNQTTSTHYLTRGQALAPNQFLRSANGLFTLVMQSDGNLVIYNQLNQAIWHINRFGTPVQAAFQTDGNFVVYHSIVGRGVVAVWDTHTANTAANLLVLQDDSNLVLYGGPNNTQVFWHRLQ
jgi:subtilisin family serine protease